MLWIAFAALAVAFVGAFFWLRGRRHGEFDLLAHPHVERFPGAHPSDPSHAAVSETMQRAAPLLALPMREQLPALRAFMDELGMSRASTAQLIPVDAGDVRGEWVLAPGADPSVRTLYIHGGAFTMGSPRSHRPLTEHFSRLTGGAVFAVDYRLMPEHRRSAGIADCRAAYRWVLDNGPDGPGPCSALVVAGDSAGGNLTLSTIAWARDARLRRADAAVALSPLTDASFGSPSMKANVATDTMLGPMFGKLARLPKVLLPFVGGIMSQARPSNPDISPLHGDLHDLPPILVQASESEMLHDDAHRYVAKAVAAGTLARFQTWEHMPHVWQMFDPYLDEANHALDEIGGFLDEFLPRRPASAGSAQAAAIPK